MSTQDTAGTAREGTGAMSDETTRLRALCATIPAGPVKPCCAAAGDPRHSSSWALGKGSHGSQIIAWVDGPVQFLAEARTALPTLLDAAERAERAEARVRELEARLQFADDGLKKLTDAGWDLATQRDRLRAEVTRLREIIAGRTTPPTHADLIAHEAAGGRWLVRDEVGGDSIRDSFDARMGRPRAVRLIALDADGRPCAWPTAEVSRG